MSREKPIENPCLRHDNADPAAPCACTRADRRRRAARFARAATTFEFANRGSR